MKLEQAAAMLWTALMQARDHLEYCGYGDDYEREGACQVKLPETIDEAIAAYENYAKGEKAMSTREFFIAGVKFHKLNTVISKLKVGDKFTLVAEPDNKFDSNAVRLEFDGTMCGYVPKTLSAEVSALLEIHDEVNCEIIQLDPTEQPWNQCKVKVWTKIDPTGVTEEQSANADF